MTAHKIASSNLSLKKFALRNCLMKLIIEVVGIWGNLTLSIIYPIYRMAASLSAIPI